MYCVLEGDVTKDNGVLQTTYQNFLRKVYTQTSKSCQSRSLDIERSLSSYESVNNALTLVNILEMTLVKFFEYLSFSSKSIYVPFEALITEYNSRLDVLVKMLTRDEYRLLAWPIPELCSIDLASASNLTLK